MPRRAPRRVDPALDLSRHLLGFDDVPRPWDPARLFGRTAPVEIEVGSGKGLFLSGAAAARPDVDFLGIEIARKFAQAVAARLARAAVTNARVLNADAQRLFAEVLPDASLAAVHVYFPDPWWKKRHHKRRLMNERFVRDVERTLLPGGLLHFWTDVEEYFTESLETLARATNFG
ncbi:MAG: tRNA (guanosine(46)-N7)-methyltransferase TrmB, partial [Pirellulales bacterium]